MSGEGDRIYLIGTIVTRNLYQLHGEIFLQVGRNVGLEGNDHLCLLQILNFAPNQRNQVIDVVKTINIFWLLDMVRRSVPSPSVPHCRPQTGTGFYLRDHQTHQIVRLPRARLVLQPFNRQ